jgi:hypothetical protein
MKIRWFWISFNGNEDKSWQLMRPPEVYRELQDPRDRHNVQQYGDWSSYDSKLV